MLRIPTYIAPSRIHGIGLFAAEAIPAKTQIVDILPGFDRCYSAAEVASLPQKVQDFIKVYGHKDKWDGMYYVAIDDTRFTNHSDAPNTYFDDSGNWLTLRAIKKDEELTANYREFDAEWENYLPAMINEEKNARKTA